MERADVIAAVATAAGKSAVGVVRLSGPRLDEFLKSLLGRVPEPRRATLTDFLNADGAPIDTGLALYFPAPHSYTGEDVLELQGHGGPAVLSQLLERCLRLGARMAQPGEFTRRAFLNDKLDLAQAESIADLIEASSEAAARSAMRSLKGEFSKEIGALVSGLVDLRVLVEACIDFPEEDTELLEERGARRRLSALTDAVGKIKHAATTGSLLREGAYVVLVGRPNVGKSSLLNRLAGEDIAIVTEIPGTTRDAIRQHILLEGVPMHVVDTAGLRESTDPVERLGVARTWEAINRADLALVVVDAGSGASCEDADVLRQLPSGIKTIVVANKIDLIGVRAQVSRTDQRVEVHLSALSGEGIDLLRREILRGVGWHPGEEGVFLARQRHLDALDRAALHLARAQASALQLEIFAEELRLAQMALSEITGEFSADDLLGEIFSRFCIGK
jgi:tRNA modification GTPase